MARFLLDTNTISEPMRPQPDVQVMAKLEEHQTELAIASVVWHELLFGVLRLPISKKRSAIEAYLFQVVAATTTIAPYDARAAECFARERARLAAAGQTPSYPDGQIAAIAAVNDLTLVTRNISDFNAFQNIDIVKWHES
ncbi:MAG: type II toxin-antitoxin system VapC family toxin [Caldilineaceae bacterium]